MKNRVILLFSIAVLTPFFKVHGITTAAPVHQSVAFEARAQYYFLPVIQQLKNALLDEQFRLNLNKFVVTALKQKDLNKETKEFLTVLAKGLNLNWKAIEAQQNQMTGPLSSDLQKKYDQNAGEQQALHQNPELKKITDLADPQNINNLIAQGTNQVSVNLRELQKAFKEIEKSHDKLMLLDKESQTEHEKKVANATDLKALEAWESELAHAINNYIGGE